MPDIDMKELGRQLKAHKPSKVYIIYGSESYLKKKALDTLLSECVPEDSADVNFSRASGCTQVKSIIEQMTQYPFLSDKKCVLVEDFDTNAAGQTGIEELCASFDEIVPGCVVIFWQNDISGYEKNKPFQTLLKAVQRNGSVMKFDTPKYGEFTNAVADMAQERGLKLSVSDARYLTERVGGSLQSISTELEKLELYCDKKPVSREIIDLICPLSLDKNIFKISQNILEGRNDDAFAIVEALLAEKTEPIEIFSRLCDNFIDLARAKAGSSAGMSVSETAKLFGKEYATREFALKNAYAVCGKSSSALIRRYITLLYECDKRMKTAGTNRKICLEKLVAQLCLAGVRGK